MEKVGFLSIRQRSGVFFTIWQKSGGFVHMARKWGFLDMEKSRVFVNKAKKWGFLQYGKKVGVLSIWQESGVFIDMEKIGV
jgi:hypothetical protein